MGESLVPPAQDETSYDSLDSTSTTDLNSEELKIQKP